jgi:hypothetical protein
VLGTFRKSGLTTSNAVMSSDPELEESSADRDSSGHYLFQSR